MAMAKLYKRTVEDDQAAVDVASALISDCVPFSYDFTKTHVFAVIDDESESLDEIIAERLS